ncbi:MAG TPA: hypothetical protein VGM90_27090 [Kofleriaceae bacterium]
MIAKVAEYKDRICACKDKDCATKVNDDYTKWGTEMTSKMASDKGGVRPDEDTDKKLTEYAMAYSDCMTSAMSAGSAPPADTAPTPPVATDEYGPWGPALPIDADVAARAAREWGQTKRKVAPSRVELQFVDENGILQDGGSIRVFFSNELPDDPKRKTGMPVRKSPDANGCFVLTLEGQQWHNYKSDDCQPGFRQPIRCSTKQVFAKAVAAKMPADAAAVMLIKGTTKLQWEVTVDDDPRDVHFAEKYDDDCPLAVEAPK